MVTPEKETEATAYERELSDDQLLALAGHVGARVSALLGQGVNLPMQQIENHHLIGLLECFVGPDESLRVREWHLTWLDSKLDAIEAQMRMQMLSALNGDSA
jgi:hypothetical protein